MRDVLSETYAVGSLTVVVAGAPQYEEGKLLGFYFACRRHISEMIIGDVWEAVFSKVTSPDNPMFKNVKEKLNKDCPRVLA